MQGIPEIAWLSRNRVEFVQCACSVCGIPVGVGGRRCHIRFPFGRSLDPSVSFAAICDTLRIGLTPGWVFTSTPTDGPYVASFKMVGWVKLQAELRPGVTIAEGAESIIGLAANGGVKNMKVVTSFFLRPAIQELIGQNEIVASGVLPFYERISALPSPGALGWVPSESNSADSTSRL